MIDRILDELHPEPGQLLLEIGPGQGALTLPLLRSQPGCSLTVVELDRELAARLLPLTRQYTGFAVHQEDALRIEFDQFLGDGSKLRVFGNLPYQISTPLLFRLFDQMEHVEDMLFLLQKEVVERICADPGSRTYGRLSVMCQYFCHVEQLFVLGPEVFQPPPKVESALVVLRPRPMAGNPAHHRLFAEVVKAAFAQRRKILANSLQGLCAAAQFEAAGISPGARAEQLSVEEYRALTDCLLEVRREQPASD